MLTVGDLLEVPHLRLTMFAGATGLRREVVWVHISDLPNPWEWLGDGELLLTNGLSLPADGAGQIDFLGTLHDAGASGLAVGTDMPGAPSLRDEARARADELGLAVLLVPYSVPFSAIVRTAADANTREEAQRVARITRVYELLRAATARGESRSGLLRRLGEQLNCRFLLVDPELGTPLDPTVVTSNLVDELAEAYAEHAGRLPGALHLGRSHHRGIAVSIHGAQPAALLAEPVSGRLPDPDLLHHVATVGALELADLHAERERRRRRGAELVARLLDGTVNPAAARAELGEFGLGAGAAVLAACRRDDLGEAGESLHHQLARRAIPHAIGTKEPNLLALLPSSQKALDQALAVLAATGAPVGVSARLGQTGRTAEATREALWSLGIAKGNGRSVVRFADESTLLLPRTLDEASLVVSRILGPLVAYDREHGTELLCTLRVVLAADRSWAQAAAELHVHKQTLGYRIRQIEHLTDRNLRSTKDLSELWFGLRAYQLTQGRSPDDDVS